MVGGGGGGGGDGGGGRWQCDAVCGVWKIENFFCMGLWPAPRTSEVRCFGLPSSEQLFSVPFVAVQVWMFASLHRLVRGLVVLCVWVTFVEPLVNDAKRGLSPV